jgi:SAM-dependent methyltransferase
MSRATESARIQRVYAARARVPSRNDSLFEPGNLFIAQERARLFLRELGRQGGPSLGERDILEIGCGTGAWLRELIHFGARPERVTGVDLLPDRVAEARLRLPAAVELAEGDGAHTRFSDASFDVVLQSTVFSSILEPAVRREVAREMLRLVRPGGLIVWYDARVDSPTNPHFVGVSRREIGQLFPGCHLRLRSLTLAPPLARRLAPLSLLACQLLAAVPLLRTHYLAFIRPGAR